MRKENIVYNHLGFSEFYFFTYDEFRIKLFLTKSKRRKKYISIKNI